MKEMRKKSIGMESISAKKQLPEIEKMQMGKIQTVETQTGKMQAGETSAGKTPMWKIPLCYILWAVLSILFTGLISLCIGVSGFLSGETGKSTVEIFSSLLGSIYLSFLLGRFKEKEWERRRSREEIKTSLSFGMILFVCRIISRLVFSLFPEGVREIGYFTVLIMDLICIILLYSQIPAGRKEGESHA